jgi:protein SCO1/2
MKRLQTALLVLSFACGTPAPVGTAAPTGAAPADPQLAAGPLPSESFYNLHPILVDQHARATTLDVHRGHPVIVSMFYTSCPNACPMLIADLRALEASLPEAKRGNLRVLLVSMDPVRDTPEAMAEIVERHGIDDARWSLVRPEPEAVREIAAALGIKYRPLANGEMNHSSLLTLLDIDGSPVARLEGLQRDAQPLRDALDQASAPAHAVSQKP